MLKHFGFYHLRRPTKPIDFVMSFHDQLSDHLSFEELLLRCFNDEIVNEAIFIASPDFFKRCVLWASGNEVSEKKQLLYSLYKYILRISIRCTPFGLFACCGIGGIAGTSSLIIKSDDTPECHYSLDIECLLALSDWLTSQKNVRKQLKVYTNTSLYFSGDNYRYIETIRHANTAKHYISQIQNEPYLEAIFQEAKHGSSIKVLVKLLMNMGFKLKESELFINNLIENQLLVFDLQPNITGPDYFSYISSKLDSSLLGTPLRSYLTDLQQILDEKPLRDLGERLKAKLSQMDCLAPKNPLKIDAHFVPEKNRLSESAISKIGTQISELMVLNRNTEYVAIKRFKDQFKERYGTQELPILLALDSENGIGYGDSTTSSSYLPLLDELRSALKKDHKKNAGPWESFILNKYVKAIKQNSNLIDLTEEDIHLIGRDKETLSGFSPASSFYVFGNVLSSSSDAIDRGEFLFNLLGCKGPSSVNMMSRFANQDRDLAFKLKECAIHEELHHPEVTFAEIVHLPENHAGNIMNRINMYSHEIVYLGQPTLEEEFVIRLDDVFISIINDQLVLRSKRLNRRIIPRLSNAHNFKKGLPVYHFMCDLQSQDANINLRWDWSNLEEQPSLPRVQYKNIIVSRQTWLLQSKDYRELNLDDLLEKFKDLSLPEVFVVASGDNELLINLEIEESIALLLRLLKKNDRLRIFEFLHSADNCVLSDGKNKFTSEFVIPFFDDSVPPMQGFSKSENSSIVRRFAYGSEWLYVKIYSGERFIDRFLVDFMRPFVKRLLSEQMIDHFYFTRFHDPNPHLRFRFCGDPKTFFFETVLTELHTILNPLIETKQIRLVQTDVYDREIERYGSKNIQTCENLFSLHSNKTLDFLYLQNENYQEDERFIFAITSINQLLESAGLDLSSKKEFMKLLKESFFAEFNGDLQLRKKLNKKYQAFKESIDHAIRLIGPCQVETSLMTQIIENTFENNQNFTQLLGSLAHMFINRIFLCEQRRYELLIYHCLFKHYDFLMSRNNKGKVLHESIIEF